MYDREIDFRSLRISFGLGKVPGMTIWVVVDEVQMTPNKNKPRSRSPVWLSFPQFCFLLRFHDLELGSLAPKTSKMRQSDANNLECTMESSIYMRSQVIPCSAISRVARVCKRSCVLRMSTLSILLEPAVQVQRPDYPCFAGGTPA